MRFFGRIIVAIFSRLIPGNMGYYWRTSIAASYTAVEIRTMLDKIGLFDWSVESDLMDLTIYKD